MAQGRSRLRFAEQMAASNLVERALRQQLQRHVAVQYLISRAIHHTHATFAKLRDDSVVIQRLSDHGCGQRAILTRPRLQTGRRQSRNGPQVRIALTQREAADKLVVSR